MNKKMHTVYENIMFVKTTLRAIEETYIEDIAAEKEDWEKYTEMQYTRYWEL